MNRRLGYFGAVSPSKHTLNFYQDTSFQKPIKQKLLLSQTTKLKLTKLQKATQNLQLLSVKNQQRAYRQHRLQKLLQVMKDFFNHYQYMNRVAVKIQKVYRGHMGRRSLDRKFIKKRKGQIREHSKTLRKNNFQLVFHTGLLPEVAALRLTRAFRRCMFRAKIKRIKATFEYFCDQKIFVSFALIRQWIYVFRARKKVNWKKFKIVRVQKLIVLRERVAILTIKLGWIKLKLDMRTMRQRMRRYKRKLKQIQEGTYREQEVKVQEKPPDNDEDSQEEQQRIHRQEMRKQKVRLARISYWVPLQKQKQFLPSIKKRNHSEVELTDIMDKLRENIKVPKNLAYLQKPLFDQNGAPLCFPQPKLDKSVKRKLTGRYMEPTISSSLSRYESKTPHYQPFQPKHFQKRLQSTLMTPTFSHSKKITHQRSISENSKSWNPNNIIKEHYVPGLDNTNYQPPAKRFSQMAITPRPQRLKPLAAASLPGPDISFVLPPESDVYSKQFSLDLLMGKPHQSMKQMPLNVKPRTETVKGYAKISTKLINQLSKFRKNRRKNSLFASDTDLVSSDLVFIGSERV